MSVVAEQLQKQGFHPFQAATYRGLVGRSWEHYERLSRSFDNLVQDSQMGDGGLYRYRRYSRFLLSPGEPIEPLDGNSIHQRVEDNPLNGGVTRTFEPLHPSTSESPLFQALLAADVELLKQIEPELFDADVVLGVHQVRITALPAQVGKPTPEGIHRDAERYTFQHLWSRRNIDGGEFRAYDENKNQVFAWLQTQALDSVLFEGATWHSATPIKCKSGAERGHRDIFLVDFDLL